MITIEINGEEYIQELNNLAQRFGKIPMPVWNDIGTLLIDSVQQNFLKEGRPIPWQPSKRVKKYGGSTLMITGELMYSGEIFEVTDTSVDVVHGVGMPGAFALQYGYEPRNLPARPYSVIQDEDETRIYEIILNYYTEGLEFDTSGRS